MDNTEETRPAYVREHGPGRITNFPHKEIPQRLTRYGGFIKRDPRDIKKEKAWDTYKRGAYE